jgi:hypothetical protein
MWINHLQRGHEKIVVCVLGYCITIMGDVGSLLGDSRSTLKGGCVFLLETHSSILNRYRV